MSCDREMKSLVNLSRKKDIRFRSLPHENLNRTEVPLRKSGRDSYSAVALFIQVIPHSQASAEGTDTEAMWIEKDILPALAGTGRARVYHTKNWWSQVKTN